MSNVTGANVPYSAVKWVGLTVMMAAILSLCVRKKTGHSSKPPVETGGFMDIKSPSERDQRPEGFEARRVTDQPSNGSELRSFGHSGFSSESYPAIPLFNETSDPLSSLPTWLPAKPLDKPSIGRGDSGASTSASSRYTDVHRSSAPAPLPSYNVQPVVRDPVSQTKAEPRRTDAPGNRAQLPSSTGTSGPSHEEPKPLTTPKHAHHGLPAHAPGVYQDRQNLVRGQSAPNPSESQRGSASACYAGQVLQPKECTLEATEVFVKELMTLLGGRFQKSLSFVSGHPPRRCMHCVEARVKMEFGKLLDILIFPKPEDFALERATTKLEWLQQNRAVVRECVEAQDWRDPVTGLLVKMPSYMLTSITTPVDTVLKGLAPATRQATVDGIGCVLIRQLAAFHGRRHLLQSSLNRRNLVRMEDANDMKWTFREFSYCVKENKLIPVWRQPTNIFLLPPETGKAAKALASARTASAANRSGHIVATSAMDIWRLGVLLYELWSGHTFWPNGIIATEVIHRLNTPGLMPLEGRLPFDQDGLRAQGAFVSMMLERNPEARPTAKELETKLGSLPETTLPGNNTYMLMMDSAVYLGFDTTTTNIMQL